MGEIAFPLEGGGVVFVETRDTDRGGLVTRDGLVTEASRSFQDAVGGLGTIADTLLQQLGSLARAPDDVELEFGVTLKLEAGVLIAKTAGEGNFKVKVKWSRPKSPP
jgi:Trypsin-co-occurring domain 1